MISKDNYEIWMMDHLDGTLSDSDQAILLQFLEENPELKTELEGLENTVLTPINDQFENKTSLLKTQADEIGIEYSEYLAIKEVEEGLSNEEKLWKSTYTHENEQNSRLFASYSQTILKANRGIRYQFKGNLKRALLVPMITINGVKRIGIAATIAILLSIGTLPFLKESVNDIKTVAVNDPPSLITMPQKQTEKATEGTAQTIQKIDTKREVTPPAKNETIINSQPKSSISINATLLKPLGIKAFENKKVNAYEVGLNAMMPIIIANNMAEREQEYLAMQSQVKQESARLSRSSRAIVGGVKVINFLSGNETKMNKVLNQDGQMVAYQLESENISIRQRIKNKPVTN